MNQSNWAIPTQSTSKSSAERTFFDSGCHFQEGAVSKPFISFKISLIIGTWGKKKTEQWFSLTKCEEVICPGNVASDWLCVIYSCMQNSQAFRKVIRQKIQENQYTACFHTEHGTERKKCHEILNCTLISTNLTHTKCEIQSCPSISFSALHWFSLRPRWILV